MQPITPCLWFDTQAEEAARFYVSVFRRSRIGTISRYGEGMHLPAGTVLTVMFELDGQQFMALNGGPGHPHTQAISLMIWCDSQEEIDRHWARLTEGGKEIQCGWLQDRYGVSWQVVPAAFQEWMESPDEAAKARMIQAVMGMVKLDAAAMRRAFEGR
jgi:predicted 3-demethylubiquinone-9 3-methyltransferase (glyoxalase superfamily)